MLLWQAYLFAFPFLCSLVATRALIKIAGRKGIVDLPGARKSHKKPVPLLGGLGIYFAFLVTVLLHVRLAEFITRNPDFFTFLPVELLEILPGIGAVWEKLRVILFGSTVMVLLVLLDDTKDLNARFKLGIQVAAAVVLVVFGIRITLFIDSILFGAAITVLWVVAITNAFNLLDNMDGLSAGVALIAALLFFVTALMEGYVFIASIILVFAGSVAGFLRYNFNPAKIFMGDTGSLFIGYVMASLTVLNRYYAGQSPTFFPVIMPVLILAVPIFDTLSVIFIRLKNRESIFRPDRRHFSHRLVNLGLSPRQAVLLVYLVCFCVGVSSILLREVSLLGVGVIIVQAVAFFGIIAALEAAGAKKAVSRGNFDG